MKNNKNLFRIILSLAIVLGFFLPWFQHSGSGWDIVRLNNGYSDATHNIIRYSFLLPAVFALIVLIRSLSSQSSGFLLRFLPFLVIAILSILFAMGVSSQYGSSEMNGFFSILGVGYYLTVIGSLLLIFSGG